MDIVRRHLAKAMSPHGYALGAKALHRDCGDGMRATLTVASWSSGYGEPVRSVLLELSAYRVSDYEGYLAHYGWTGEFEATTLPFMLGERLGRMLPRPHEHAWIVHDREDLRRCCEQVEQIYREHALPHLDAWLSTLRNVDTSEHLPGRPHDGQHLKYLLLTDEDRDSFNERWLDDWETCPLPPCGEAGRPVSGGGTWPDDVVRGLAFSDSTDA